MTRYVVLLRGINVGKAKRIAMADLRAVLTAESYEGVVTVLQSGNILLDASVSGASLASAVQAAVQREFGMAVDVVVRTRGQVEAVAAKNPFGQVADDGSRYLVGFMSEPAQPVLIQWLASLDLTPDQFLFDDTEFYVWCPRGILDSPVHAALAKVKAPGTVITMRNWNTVGKIVAKL